MTTMSNPTDTIDDSLAQAEQGLPLEAPNDTPEAAGKSSNTDGSNGSRKNFIWIAIFVAIVVACAVAIPTALFVGDSDGSSASPSTDDTGTVERSYLQASGPVYNVTIPLFDSQVARSYTSESDLRQDLEEVCKFLVNYIVDQQLQYYSDDTSARPPTDGDEQDGPAVAPQEDGTGAKGPSAEGATDFETNTQEEGVDEGDLVKSDGNFVYAAYGDSIVVWDAFSGVLIGNYTLPAVEYPTSTTEKPPPERPPEPLPEEGPTSGGGRRESIAEPYYYKPFVQSLLLYSNRLVAVVSGYGPSQQEALGYDYNSNPSALYDVLSTNLRVYGTSASGELTFIKEIHVNGYFSEARSINNYAHIVTFSGLDYYSFFYNLLGRHQPNFEGLSDEDYVVAAGLLATNELIPTFLNATIRDLSIATGELPDLAQIAFWQTAVSNSSDFESHVHDGTIVDGFAQVVSLDILDSSSDLQVSLSGALMPSGWGYTYATNEMIALVGQGWDFRPEMNGSAETTYLLVLKLIGASATPAAVGVTPGHVIDQFAVDILDGHMRIATTIRNFQPFVDAVRPVAVDTDTAPIAPPPPPETQNQVIILHIPDFEGNETVLEEVGRISDLGNPWEVFTAVRFFDNIAYVVTFERKDPYYVLDLNDVTNPVILGELNVSGFSSYLHSINADNTLILAVGDESDENGWTIGMQMSLFDSRIPTDPQLLQRLVLLNEDSRWVSSTVRWDHRAFRYLPLDTTDPATGSVVNQGILIIPLRIDGEDFFDGFFTYDVSVNAIDERFNVSHLESTEELYHGCGPWLAERSMVFNGSLTTMKRASVVSTNLDTGLRNWKLFVNQTSDEEGCVAYD